MAVGFEFAIEWKIYKDHKIESTQNSSAQKLKKAAVLFEARSGWQMTADGDEIEFVVDQVDEDPQGEGHVRVRLRTLRDFIDTLTGGRLVTHQQYLRKNDLSRTLVNSNTKFVINTMNNFNISGNPQATAGIRLGRIRKLFRILSNPDSNAAKQFIGERDDIRKFISKRYQDVAIHHSQIRDSGWPQHKPGANLRGLATLAAFYIRQGTGTGGVGAVKYLFYIMCRTSFAALFDLIQPEEAEYYRGDPGRWVSFICNDVAPKIPKMGRINPRRRLIERKIVEKVPETGKVLAELHIPITVGDWLEGMVRGIDLLSAGAHPIEGTGSTPQTRQMYTDSRGYGHRLRGVAGLGENMDDVPYNNAIEPAPVFEFRYKQRYIPSDVWPDYGLAVYRFIHELNTGNRQAALDLNFTM